MPADRAAGNAIGLYRFSAHVVPLLRAEVARWLAGGRLGAFYVAAINAMARGVPIEAVSTRSLTWCEVDDARDLAVAPAKLKQILTEERALSLATTRRARRWVDPSRLTACHESGQMCVETSNAPAA